MIKTIEIESHKFEVLKIYPHDKENNAKIYRNKSIADVIIKNTNDNSLLICNYIPEVTYKDIKDEEEMGAKIHQGQDNRDKQSSPELSGSR